MAAAMPLNQAMTLMDSVTELEYRRQYGPLVTAYTLARVVGNKGKLGDFVPPWATIAQPKENTDSGLLWLLANRLLSQELMELIGLERIARLIAQAH